MSHQLVAKENRKLKPVCEGLQCYVDYFAALKFFKSNCFLLLQHISESMSMKQGNVLQTGMCIKWDVLAN